MANNHDGTSQEQDRQATAPSTANLTTSQLRSLAQSHLLEIEEDIKTEVKAQLQTQAELQQYAKAKRKDYLQEHRSGRRSPNPASLTTSAQAAIDLEAARDMSNAEMTKGPRLRSAGDVLDRLKWDPSVNIDEYSIGYLERFEGIQEMPVRNWVRESTDEEFIPQHRIKWIKRRAGGMEEIVWDRQGRIDKIFGSGVASGTDSDSVAEQAALESVVDSVDGGVRM